MSVASVLGHLDPLDSGTNIEDPSNPPGCSSVAEIDCDKSTWTHTALCWGVCGYEGRCADGASPATPRSPVCMTKSPSTSSRC